MVDGSALVGGDDDELVLAVRGTVRSSSRGGDWTVMTMSRVLGTRVMAACGEVDNEGGEQGLGAMIRDWCPY